MFWQEDYSDTKYQVPDDIIDLLFSIDCKRIPVDHAYALSHALHDAVSWLADEPGASVHPVHVAGSQNGWERPEHGTDQQLLLSHRTKLTIRVPKGRAGELQRQLTGRTVDIAGCAMTIGQAKERHLSAETTIFSRYVVSPRGADEDAFLHWAADELDKLGIRMRKALCGKTSTLHTPREDLRTRSLMLAELPPSESVRLQQAGLGPNRRMGCGIFIPHKGIEAVG